MIGKAKSMGAISIVSAVASGKGASLAVNLPTFAKVSVFEQRGEWQVFVNGARLDSVLAVRTVNNTLRMLGKAPRDHSGTIETSTSVPFGVGLKTSSASSVAVSLATASAFGEDSIGSKRLLRISAASSLEAGVSLTGAMDDAASCLMGGVNFVDNSAGNVALASKLGRSLPVLIKVPRGNSRRTLVSRSALRKFSKMAESIYTIGKKGGLWKAMTLNGILFSSIYGYDACDSVEAIGLGAVGASLSGTGPAVGAVFDDQENLERAADHWAKGSARLIRTETSDAGAKIAH